MDPIANSFSPSASTRASKLAGREAVQEQVRVAIERLRHGRQSKSVLIVGLRGVGKTMLLDQLRRDAENADVVTIRIEAQEGRALPALLAPQLRQVLLQLSCMDEAKDVAVRGLRALAGFVGRLNVTYADIEVGLDYEPEASLADNGELEGDLGMLLAQSGQAARAEGTALVMFIDELQCVAEEQTAALISALQRCAQDNLPVIVAGAGPPQLRGRMGDAKAYAERLFDFPEIGPLASADSYSVSGDVHVSTNQGNHA